MLMKTAGTKLLEPRWQGSLNEYTTAVVWSPTGQYLAVSSAAGDIQLINLYTAGQPTILRDADGQSIDCLGFSAQGEFLAAGGQEGL
jgi:WD40 repeat protein